MTSARGSSCRSAIRDPNNRPGHSTHSLGTAFGAAAAAAALLRFDARRVRHVLSYAAQQASGVPYWHRDTEHVEKAFDFGGMGARNGVAGALMVAAGFSGIDDAFSGRNHFFTAFGEKPQPGVLAREPRQPVRDHGGLDQEMVRRLADPGRARRHHGAGRRAPHLRPTTCARIRITMPDDRMHIVDNRSMPDVCVQHLAAIAIIDGTVSFAAAHDHDRMHDQAVQAVRSRIN